MILPPREYIERRLEELYSDDTYTLIARCIKLAKANDLSPEALSVRLDSLHDRTRSGMFKRFFLPVFETYQEILSENGTIDFEGHDLEVDPPFKRRRKREVLAGSI